ncbi:hypothetical protein [Specibacter cremeus]|uniref:hypothetical protein n=1 Tax=Specibacter cremeus TaxID=1629051 RepID=UPI000F76B1CE|nr:hypothetical protein [Specibacter cremeus]
MVIVAFIAYLQKVTADKRAQWWTRAQWAIEAATDDTDRKMQQLGVVVLMSLWDNKLSTRRDKALLVGIVELIRDEVLDEPPELQENGRDDASGGESSRGTHDAD